MNCKSFELLHAARLERGLAAAIRGSAAETDAARPSRCAGLARHLGWGWMRRFPIGLTVCLAMLALLGGLGGAVAAPSYPEVATPTPLARYVLGPLSARHGCSAASRCRRPRPQSLPPSP